jgi:hypothetical protein
MPTCIHCNRAFLNKDALHQHLASSGNQHPFCEKCDRRFISQVALESVSFFRPPLSCHLNSQFKTFQHIAARHPPTYDCEPCKRSFTTPFALDDHYRGSTAHPNCAQCGKGFKDFGERHEVLRSCVLIWKLLLTYNESSIAKLPTAWLPAIFAKVPPFTRMR